MNDTFQKNLVPFILSFFIPGLGQLLQGRIPAAAGFFLGCLFLCVSVCGLAVVPIIWIWNLFDAATFVQTPTGQV